MARIAGHTAKLGVHIKVLNGRSAAEAGGEVLVADVDVPEEVADTLSFEGWELGEAVFMVIAKSERMAGCSRYEAPLEREFGLTLGVGALLAVNSEVANYLVLERVQVHTPMVRIKTFS